MFEACTFFFKIAASMRRSKNCPGGFFPCGASKAMQKSTSLAILMLGQFWFKEKWHLGLHEFFLIRWAECRGGVPRDVLGELITSSVVHSPWTVHISVDYDVVKWWTSMFPMHFVLTSIPKQRDTAKCMRMLHLEKNKGRMRQEVDSMYAFKFDIEYLKDPQSRPREYESTAFQNPVRTEALEIYRYWPFYPWGNDSILNLLLWNRRVRSWILYIQCIFKINHCLNFLIHFCLKTNTHVGFEKAKAGSYCFRNQSNQFWKEVRAGLGAQAIIFQFPEARL